MENANIFLERTVYYDQFMEPPNTAHINVMARNELFEFKKDSVSESDSFHRAFSKIIIIAQCFGLMPVYGVTAVNASYIRFKWLSVRVIYTGFSLLGIFFMTSLCIMRFFKYGRSFKETQCTVFYGCSLGRMLLFLLLARHWPGLASRWEQVESTLGHYGYSRNLRRKFSLITAAFLSVAFIEHAFSHVRVIRLAVLCAIEDKMDGICTFFFNSFPHVYDYFPCSLWNGLIMFIVNVLCAFAWTYMDLFIILMSVALTDRFRQLNRCLKSVQGKVAGTIVTYELILVQFSGIHADERDSAAHSVARRYCL
ncbi:hypothetical protein ANN_25300 [Periplaneta americana]|uniref:Gustatory receptor n=1 Tax=Periplaneta americana TaxID=6978 RepID=A0ABQ8S1A3_PERAM|nr:hypothetical protein ANN_25300 [Periplaneta americana]